MNFEDYIQTMAENCLQIYEEMTGQTASGLHVEKIEPTLSTARYRTAIVIPYENKEENIAGRFILGFENEPMAISLAAAIASYTGMPPIDGLDDLAMDILFEFMNTVAGKVITEWDAMGLAADFFPPEFIADLGFQGNDSEDLLIHAITFSGQNDQKITILACLEENNRSPLKNKKVLIVDDSKMIRFLLSKEFTKHGCQVSEAENGLDGFIRNQSTSPDLIIMDLIMPKMGGLEAIAKIREMNPNVHIIVLTSTSKKEEVLEAMTHKIKGYVKKPIQMDKLLKLSRSCFQ